MSNKNEINPGDFLLMMLLVGFLLLLFMGTIFVPPAIAFFLKFGITGLLMYVGSLVYISLTRFVLMFILEKIQELIKNNAR